jgi:acetylornithine/succinyldiaminopimelate/putrescine aminotransferase
MVRRAMFDYGFATFASKADLLQRAERAWNPGKTRFWQEAGVDLVIDRREGYRLWDMDGRELIDCHLNGGTYNLGHRNPELVAALVEGAQHFDMGNHHFPAIARTAFAEQLVAGAGPGMRRVLYGAAGGEAIDLALKTARHTTQRRRIVSIHKGYHGHTGLAVCTGDERFSRLFLSERPEEFVHVPFNDLDAMAAALAADDVAAVLLETIPATYGFPLPAPGYLAAVKALCERHGTLYIADEVQTGLLRTGELWAIHKAGVQPDMLVTAKGLGGGLYPLSAVIVDERCSAWMEQDGFAHMSTVAGAELGCVVGMKALEITQRPEVRAGVLRASARFTAGLERIRSDHPDWFVGLRQDGLVMGLEFGAPEGAKPVMRALYERGVWAIFSTLDPSVLQFKPGLLVDDALVDTVLECVADAVAVTARG